VRAKGRDGRGVRAAQEVVGQRDLIRELLRRECRQVGVGVGVVADLVTQLAHPRHHGRQRLHALPAHEERGREAPVRQVGRAPGSSDFGP